MRYNQTHNNPTNSTEIFLHSNKPTDSLRGFYLTFLSAYKKYILYHLDIIYSISYAAHSISPVFQCAFPLARPTSVSVVLVSLRLTGGDVTPGIIGVTRLREVDVDGWILRIVVPKKAVDSLKLTQ